MKKLLTMKNPMMDTLLNIVSSATAILGVITTYLTQIIDKADTWVVKVPLAILILSLAFFNCARGINYLRRRKNRDDKND